MQRLCPTRTHKKGGTVTLLPPQRETGGQGRDGGRRRFTMTILCYLDFFAICIYLTFLKPSTGDLYARRATDFSVHFYLAYILCSGPEGLNLPGCGCGKHCTDKRVTEGKSVLSRDSTHLAPRCSLFTLASQMLAATSKAFALGTCTKGPGLRGRPSGIKLPMCQSATLLSVCPLNTKLAAKSHQTFEESLPQNRGQND